MSHSMARNRFYAGKLTAVLILAGVWASACTARSTSTVNPPPKEPASAATVSMPGQIEFPPTRPAAENTPGAARPTSPANQPTNAAASTPNPLVLEPGSLPEELSSAPHYAIDLKIGPDLSSFSGTAAIDYTNAESVSLDRLYFRLLPNGGASYGNGSLTVASAMLNDQPAATRLSGDATILEVSIPEPLSPGETTRLSFEFAGQVPVDFGGAGNESGYGIFNYTQDVLTLSAWYPMLAVFDEDGWNLDMPSDIGDSVFADMANFDVRVDAPADLVIASTGVLQDKQITGDRQILQVSSGPAREFALVMSPDFIVNSRQTGRVTINSFFLPDSAEGGQATLKTSLESIETYSELFGPYPYAELDVVGAPMRYASGVEFPGIIIIASENYSKPDNLGLTITTAHEVAHQWWYNTIGNDIFDDPWLDEALTTYSSEVYLEESYGGKTSQVLIDYWQRRYDELVESGRDDIVTNSLGYFESLNDPGVYGGVVYTKGALFFNALRQEIGDAAFFSALREYYDLNRFDIARPANLLDLFEKTSGKQLDGFYNTWLYSAQP